MKHCLCIVMQLECIRVVYKLGVTPFLVSSVLVVHSFNFSMLSKIEG